MKPGQLPLTSSPGLSTPEKPWVSDEHLGGGGASLCPRVWAPSWTEARALATAYLQSWAEMLACMNQAHLGAPDLWSETPVPTHKVAHVTILWSNEVHCLAAGFLSKGRHCLGLNTRTLGREVRRAGRGGREKGEGGRQGWGGHWQEQGPLEIQVDHTGAALYPGPNSRPGGWVTGCSSLGRV